MCSWQRIIPGRLVVCSLRVDRRNRGGEVEVENVRSYTWLGTMQESVMYARLPGFDGPKLRHDPNTIGFHLEVQEM